MQLGRKAAVQGGVRGSRRRTWELHRCLGGGLSAVYDFGGLLRALVGVRVVVVHRKAWTLHGVSVHVAMGDGAPPPLATMPLPPERLHKPRYRGVGVTHYIWPIVRIGDLW